MFGLVSRRRYNNELAALRAKVEQLRSQRDKALKSASTWHSTASRTSEMFADTSVFNTCLIEDLTTLRAQLAEARAQLTDGVVGQWRTQALTEKNRADALQRRLDDAMGLNTSQVKAGRNWQSTRTDGGRKQAIL